MTGRRRKSQVWSRTVLPRNCSIFLKKGTSFCQITLLGHHQQIKDISRIGAPSYIIVLGYDPWQVYCLSVAAGPLPPEQRASSK